MMQEPSLLAVAATTASLGVGAAVVMWWRGRGGMSAERVAAARARPDNVGILALEVYFPNKKLEQASAPPLSVLPSLLSSLLSHVRQRAPIYRRRSRRPTAARASTQSVWVRRRSGSLTTVRMWAPC